MTEENYKLTTPTLPIDEDLHTAVEEAIQRLVREGLLVDFGAPPME